MTIFRVTTRPRSVDALERRLRTAPLHIPTSYERCQGFTLFGRRIRSMVCSTDVATIRNSNADAIFAVYPFTAQPAITQALLTVAEAPLFGGVGGGTTTGKRSTELAVISEIQGVAGVILNATATVDMVACCAASIDIPVLITVTHLNADVFDKIYAGARMVNVAAGRATASVAAQLCAAFPTLPIIATGGPTEKSADAARQAGANALIWTPPCLHLSEI